MFTWWPSLIMGWPAVGVSMCLFVAGLFGRRPGLVLAGSLVSAPFCLFVSAYPRIGLVGLVVLGSNFVSAWASRRNRPMLAAGSMLPFVVLVSVLAVAALGQ